jgi:hypothetical protein
MAWRISKSKPQSDNPQYREVADKFHGEWVSNELTGGKPTAQDEMQGAFPRREWVDDLEAGK